MSDLTIPIAKTYIPNHELTGAALALKANTELVEVATEELDKRSAEILDLIQNHLIPTLNTQMEALQKLLDLEIALQRQCTLLQGQHQQLWDAWQKERDMISKKEEMIYQTQIIPLQNRYEKLHQEHQAFHGTQRNLEAYFHNRLGSDASSILCAVERAQEKIKAAGGDTTPHKEFRKGYIRIFQPHWKE